MVKPELIGYNKTLILEDFNCGKDEINDFLKNLAVRQEKERITKIFAFHLQNRVIAYTAVFCSHLYFKLPALEKEFRVPGICIGQLGVDLTFQKRGLGFLMIKHCISLANTVGEYSACRILYCEAFDEAMDYYEKHKFILVKKRPNRNLMFLDLNIPL